MRSSYGGGGGGRSKVPIVCRPDLGKLEHLESLAALQALRGLIGGREERGGERAHGHSSSLKTIARGITTTARLFFMAWEDQVTLRVLGVQVVEGNLWRVLPELCLWLRN